MFLDLSLDWRVLGFTTAVAVATALLFGTVPALRAARVEPNEALKDQGRGVAGGRHAGLGHSLVIAQVALSVVLVVGRRAVHAHVLGARQPGPRVSIANRS